jgi:LPS sulfotransferase NodH
MSVRLRRALHRGRLAARSRLRRYPVHPFFVLFAHRSGSGLLAEYLNCLQGVRCLREVLQTTTWWGVPRPDLSRRVVLRHLRHSLNAPGGPHVGARLALRHLVQQRLAVPDLAAEFPTARFVVLYRPCLADQYVSWHLAIQTGEWRRLRGERPRHPASTRPRVRVHRAGFLEYARAVRTVYDGIFAAEAVRHRGVVVAYDELVADPQHVVDTRLAPLLGVESCPVSARRSKQNTGSPEDVVVNFAEVRDLWADPAHRLSYPTFSTALPMDPPRVRR